MFDFLLEKLRHWHLKNLRARYPDSKFKPHDILSQTLEKGELGDKENKYFGKEYFESIASRLAEADRNILRFFGLQSLMLLLLVSSIISLPVSANLGLVRLDELAKFKEFFLVLASYFFFLISVNITRSFFLSSILERHISAVGASLDNFRGKQIGFVYGLRYTGDPEDFIRSETFVRTKFFIKPDSVIRLHDTLGEVLVLIIISATIGIVGFSMLYVPFHSVFPSFFSIFASLISLGFLCAGVAKLILPITMSFAVLRYKDKEEVESKS